MFNDAAPSAPLQPGVYLAKKAPAAVRVTGAGNDPAWREAVRLTDFSLPWESGEPHPTTFRALHDADWLYCLFDVTDPAVAVFRKTDDKWEVASSSRAEIFFRIDDRLDPYYCLELDPVGRVLDYRANYYRRFDGEWTWPRGHLIVKAEQQREGYSVEVAISKSSLRDLGLLHSHGIEAGLYRGNRVSNNDSDPEFSWISWITPEAPTPDFHIPSSFGLITLED